MAMLRIGTIIPQDKLKVDNSLKDRRYISFKLFPHR